MADVLLLPFDGTNGSTSIIDGSSSPHAISVFGNAALSTAQSKFGSSASLYLDGSGDYISAVTGTDFAFGTGDYTVEGWVYPTTVAGLQIIYDSRAGTVGSATGMSLAISAGTLRCDTSVANVLTGGTLVANTWYHVALVRSSGTTRLCLNGAQVASTATTITLSDGVMKIGQYGSASYFTGYIDDFRIDKGTARYTSFPFSTPGAIFPSGAVTGVTVTAPSAFLPGEAANLGIFYAGYKYGENTTWSLSCDDPAAFAYTTEDTGNAAFQPSGAIYLTYGTINSEVIKRHGAASLFFPSGARLAMPTGSTVIPAYSEFTLEFWINVTAASVATQVLYAGSVSNDLAMYALGGTFVTAIGTSASVPNAVWHHYAVCRKANIMRHYINGVKFAEALSLGALTLTQIGHGVASSYYLDSIGFANGYAYYGSDSFLIPNTPFYNVPSSQGVRLQVNVSLIPCEASGTTITPAIADTQWSKTVFLLRGGGADGSSQISETRGRYLISSGTVVYSASQRKHLDTSIYFNGVDAKIDLNLSRSLDFFDGRDFTIEFWMYPTRMLQCAILNKWGDIRKSYAISMLTDGTVNFYFMSLVDGATNIVSGPAPVAINTWSFVSVCKYGLNYRVSVNGTGGTIFTTTKTPNQGSDRLYSSGGYGGDSRSWDGEIVIGANGPTGAYPAEYYQGFIEDFRITNGFARYSDLALYPTPTQSFLPSGSGIEGDPYWASVVFLAHFDEPLGTVSGIRDAKGHVISLVGNAYTAPTGMYAGCLVSNAYSYVQLQYGSEFDFSTGDFTIEFFTAGAIGTIVSNNYNHPLRGFSLINAGGADPSDSTRGGYLQWTQWNDSGVQDIALSNLYAFLGERGNRWFHIAIVRNGNDITIFVDGKGNTTTISRRPSVITDPLYFLGYPSHTRGAIATLDELRITRAARYTQDFVVPNGIFPETAFSFGNAVISEFYSFIPGAVKAAQTVPGAIVPVTYSVSPPLIIGKPKVYGVTLGHANSVLAAIPTGGEGFVTSFSVIETITVRQTLSDGQVFYVNDEALAQAVRGIASGLSVVDTASAMLASVGWSDAMSFGMSLPPISQATAPITDAVIFEPRMEAAHGVVVAVSINISSGADRAWHERMAEVMTLSAPLGASSLVVNAGDSFSTIDIPSFASGASIEVSISLASETAPAWHRDIEEVMTLAMPACFVSQPAAAADTVSILSETAPAWHRAASSGIGFGSASSPVAILVDTATDSVSLNGVASTSLTLYITMGEDVALGEATAQQLLFQVVMQESVNLSAFFASPAFTTWAMNTRNAAVTQYSNFQFNSFAKMGERYLGANDQGLYWLDGDTDATRPVNSRITTGILQPNGNKIAGVQYAYLGMRGNGQFVVTVTDEAGGSYNYTLDATNMATSRVVVGRGFRTRYFTFSLESQGQDFDIDSIEFVTSEIARKLQR